LRESAARLRRLVENMLLLASEAVLESAQEPLLLQRALPRIVAMEQRLDQAHPIRLEMPGDLPPVLANDGFLEQVLSNLLSNARKYGTPMAPITIEVRQSQSGLLVGVANSGEELSDEQAAQFYVPFYRDRRTAGRVEGVGLGLAVCKSWWMRWAAKSRLTHTRAVAPSSSSPCRWCRTTNFEGFRT
jgi:two-component system sensor histidine kinase KdpD